MSRPYRARKPVSRGSHRERARRGARPWVEVVLARRDVVRRVGMVQRREELDVAAAGPELPLSSPVCADAVLLAVVIRREEPFHGPEPRRLHVHGARRPGQRFDVLDGVDDRVPGHAVAVGLEHGQRLVCERGILEPGARKTFGHAPVEHGVGRRVDDRAFVLAFEVDGIDRAGLGELGDQLLGPARVRVELEAEGRIEGQPRVEPLRGRRVAEPSRDDERHRPRLAPDRVAERPVGLAQREVESRAFESPAPVVVVRVLGGLRIEERQRREVLGEGVEGPRAGEREVWPAFLESIVLFSVIGDVLADPLLAASLKPDDRRLAEEIGARLQLEQVERVLLDLRAGGPARRRTGSQGGERYRHVRREPRVRDDELAVHFSGPAARVLVQVREHERRDALAGHVLPRSLGDRLLDEVLDVEALGRRAREKQATAAELPVRRGRAGRRCARRRLVAARAAPRSRSRTAAACPSGSRERGCRASPGAPSSPGCRGATSRRSMRRARGS